MIPFVAVVRRVGQGRPPMQTNENIETNDTASSAQPARYTELQALVAGMAADFQKFYQDGNKAAGTRVRLAMQELKSFAQTVRNEVQSIKNGGKTGEAEAPEAEAEA